MNNVYDCIYLPYNSSEMNELKGKFPTAIFENAADMVHNARFSIKIENISIQSYFKTLMQLGLENHSLHFGISDKSIIANIIEELCKDHDQCIKPEYWK